MNKNTLFTLLLSAMVSTMLYIGAQDAPQFQDEEESPAVELFAETEEVAPLETEEEATEAPAQADAEKPTTDESTAEESEPVNVLQKTFAIIKPDAVANGVTGDIINLIELNGFTIVKMEKKQLTKKEAESFYAVHKDRPFFKDLVNFMISGPVVVLALEKTNAVRDWRKLMGATNPERAKVGTLRRMFGADITHNATHGSDSAKNAALELNFFFPGLVKTDA